MISNSVDLNSLSLPDLYAQLVSGGLVDRLIALMRDEDLGEDGTCGDITAIASASTRAEDEHAVVVRTRADGIVAGLATLPALVEAFAPETSCEVLSHDGAHAKKGDELVRLAGPSLELHTLERPLLNLIGRLSGVASRTGLFVRAARDAADRDVEILDTRKTTPGLRLLEKYAVRCGGGSCHRIGLYDAVLVKDNHIAGVGTDALAAHIDSLVRAARNDRPLRFVEVEVDTLEQLDALLTLEPGTVNIALLDNMGPDVLRDGVARRDAHNPSMLLEASGGIDLDTIGDIARSGVDRISIGSITHGATWLDVGMDAD